MAHLSIAVRQRGGQVEAANRLHQWISQNPVFQDVVYREFFIPASPFFHYTEPNAQFNNRIGGFMREDIMVRAESFVSISRLIMPCLKIFLRSGRPLLLSHGFSESLVLELERCSMQELAEAKIPFYIRVENVYASKRI
jgi:hypothetical protein